MEGGAVTAPWDFGVLNDLNQIIKHLQNVATFRKFCNGEDYCIVNNMLGLKMAEHWLSCCYLCQMAGIVMNQSECCGMYSVLGICSVVLCQ